jgi:hypothetical protein
LIRQFRESDYCGRYKKIFISLNFLVLGKINKSVEFIEDSGLLSANNKNGLMER